MAIKQINPYIHFNGTAEKAIRLYESALGAKADGLMRWGDQPGMCDDSPEQKNLVMHAHLRIGEGVVMVNDTPPNQPAGSDGNVEIALDFTEPAAMAKAFDALAAGGQVKMPIQDTFWGAKFGV